MRIVVIGATGFVGGNIVNELVTRGHEILGVSRKEQTSDRSNLTYIAKDVLDVQNLAETLKGYDVVVNAFSPGWSNPNLYNNFLEGSKAIHEAVKISGIKRFVIIGGAGSLYISDNVQFADTIQFPEEIIPGVKASRDYLNIVKEEKDLDWVFFSPAIEMHQGITIGRTGEYRLGRDTPVFNSEQRSVLSVEDLAVVIADEIEFPQHHQERFTAGY